MVPVRHTESKCYTDNALWRKGERRSSVGTRRYRPPCPGSGQRRSAPASCSLPRVGAIVAARTAQRRRTSCATRRSRVADAHLSTELLDADTELGLLKCKRDLLVSELASLHDMLPARVGPSSCRSFSVTEGAKSLGQGHCSAPHSRSRWRARVDRRGDR